MGETKWNQTILDEKRQTEGAVIKDLVKKSAATSTARFVIFAGVPAFITAAALTGRQVWWLPALACLLLFFLLVSRHGKIEKQLLFHRRRYFFLDHYASLADGRFYDRTPEHEAIQPVFQQAAKILLETRGKSELAEDLDLTGPFSLTGLLAEGRSPDAALRVLSWLVDGWPATASLCRSRAVAELATDLDFLLDCSALLSDRKNRLCRGILRQGEVKTEKSQRPDEAGGEAAAPERATLFLSFLSYFLPLLTVASLIGAALSLALPLTGWLAAGGVALQLILFALPVGKRTINKSYLAARRDDLTDLEGLVNYLKGPAAVSFFNALPAVEGGEPVGSLLQELKDRLVGGGSSTDQGQQLPPAASGMRDLTGLQNRQLLAGNPALALLLNGLLMWDFHLSAGISRWASKYGPYVDAWTEAVTVWEGLLALATPLFSGREVCFPEWEQGANHPVFLAGKGLVHPLLAPQTAVPNDFTLTEGISLITGSNMSGKTTLMRTIGSNICLAAAGAPVFAAHVRLTEAELFTSMRVGDDIARHTSTFYAEIKRIRAMIEAKSSGRRMVCLIDEIFKGTNSADRIAGAEATLRQLCAPGVAVLVTTHDMELCQLEDDPRIKASNYHFEEHYIDDRLNFDYLVKPGRSQTTNARYLLRLAGIEVDTVDTVDA